MVKAVGSSSQETASVPPVNARCRVFSESLACLALPQFEQDRQNAHQTTETDQRQHRAGAFILSPGDLANVLVRADPASAAREKQQIEPASVFQPIIKRCSNESWAGSSRKHNSPAPTENSSLGRTCQ